MFEQDFEKPKEKDPPKEESPATEPTSNSTAPETNSTQSNAPSPRGNPGGNDTSTTGTTANNPQNGIIPSPTVNVSNPGVSRNQIPLGPRHNFYENYPNPNVRSVPAGRQWRPTGTVTWQRQNLPFYRNQLFQRSPRWNSFAHENKQAIHPGIPFYRKAYASTAKGNSPNQAGNPANFKRKPQNPNKQPLGDNVAQNVPLGAKNDITGRNEKNQNPKVKPVGQKEKTVTPTRDPTGPWKNSQNFGVNKSNYKLPNPQPEGNRLTPNFNSVDQRENTHYLRGDSRRAPNSDGQTQSQNLPKGIVLDPKRIPYKPETKAPEIKHNAYQPLYPAEIPSLAREHFPAGRNSWNPQEISPSFKEDPERPEEHLPRPSLGSRGSVYYPDYNPYDPRENSPYLRGNTWDERYESSNTMNQPESPLFPMNTPDPKETSPYNEEDPTDPNREESFTGQSRWGMEETRFKGSPTIRQYEGEQFTSNQPKEYLPYTLDNPLKPSEDFPYSEFYPWNPEENFPSYNTVPSVPPVESRGYYPNNAMGQEESSLFPSWSSWGDHRTQAQVQKERGPYFNRNFWDQSTSLHKNSPIPPHPKENQPHSSNSPAGLQKNPTWHEGETVNYDTQITRLNSPEREQPSFPTLIAQSHPADQNEAHLFHLNHRGPCCVIDSMGQMDNPLALQDNTPSFDAAPDENQDTSLLYTEDNHTKHPRHTISPTSILPSQRNSSEKTPPEETENPSHFRDDVSTLRRNTPCSLKHPKASSLQSENTPCDKNDHGDGNNVLEQIFEDNQFSERNVGLTPERLVISTVDEVPKPKGIQSEVSGKDSERQKQRLSSILKVPCFGSVLAKYHSSSTGSPSSNGRQGPFDGNPIMPTEIPNSLDGLASEAQFQNRNVDPLNTGEHSPFDSLQTVTNPQDQVQDCLLFQA